MHDDEFDRELNKLRHDSMEARKFESRKNMIDVNKFTTLLRCVPYNLSNLRVFILLCSQAKNEAEKSGSGSEEDESPKDTMKFTVLLRKGKKDQVISPLFPH